MSQRMLKKMLANILQEIENNDHITFDDIIQKMSLEIENHIFMKEINR